MVDLFLRSFGHRVSQLRHEKGLSQEELAERSGLHRTYISGIEAGKRNVGLKAIAALSRGLGVPLSALFEGVRS